MKKLTHTIGLALTMVGFFIIAPLAHAAIAYDTSGTASGNPTASVSLTANGTANSIAVIYYAYGTGQCSNPGTPTVGGSTTGVTQLISDVTDTPTGNTEGFYYLLNPPTSSSAYAVNCNDGISIYVSIYNGVRQTSIPDSWAKGTGVGCAAFTLNTTVVTANSWLVAYFACSGAGTTVQTTGNSGTTIRQGVNTVIADSNAAVGTGSQTLSFTNTGRTTSNEVVFSFAPAADVVTPTSIFGLVWALFFN